MHKRVLVILVALSWNCLLLLSRISAQDLAFIPPMETGSNPPDQPPAGRPPASAPDEACGREEKKPAFSLYKTNYFAFNRWLGDEDAQIKFQFSAKYRVLKSNPCKHKHEYFPLYFAYTQKSFWNIGQPSAPFEESNYNPEVFLDYPADWRIYKNIRLRNIVVSPFEHESNGLDGAKSRSWNRQYLAFTFALKPAQPLDEIKAYIPDKASLRIKLWHAYDYDDQDDYLRSLGRSEDFLDYMGRGELELSLRNLFGNGSWINNQLDLKTRLFRDHDKDAYEFNFQQRIPNSNFSAFLQYCYGYGESLLRFDRHDRRLFFGLSVSF